MNTSFPLCVILQSLSLDTGIKITIWKYISVWKRIKHRMCWKITIIWICWLITRKKLDFLEIVWSSNVFPEHDVELCNDKYDENINNIHIWKIKQLSKGLFCISFSYSITALNLRVKHLCTKPLNTLAIICVLFQQISEL